MPVVLERPFEVVHEEESARQDAVLQRQQELLERRYDLRDAPSDVPMSGGRRQVQRGVRVRMPAGVGVAQLGALSPEQVREQELWPEGFRPLPHVLHVTGGMIFPQLQIDEIARAEQRDLSRFDASFDLPEHLMP
jgi:cytochrome c peroxidase